MNNLHQPFPPARKIRSGFFNLGTVNPPPVATLPPETGGQPCVGNGRYFSIRHATCVHLNNLEDLGVILNDADFVFEVMALKDQLGFPPHRP